MHKTSENLVLSNVDILRLPLSQQKIYIYKYLPAEGEKSSTFYMYVYEIDA